MMKKICALLLALLTLLALFAGCSKGNTTGTKDPLAVDEETKKLYDTVVLTIDGNDVTYKTYRYYFHELYAFKTEEDPDFFKKEGALEELRTAIVDELKMTYAIKELAAEYKIVPTEEQLKEVDEYIATLKSYMGDEFASTLASRYNDEEMFRDLLIYEQYIYSGLFEYFTGEDCDKLDFSDEAIKAFMKDYNCAVHILLTQKNYSTKENTEKVAALLKELIHAAEEAEVQITEESDSAAVIAALEGYFQKYDAAKKQMSYIGGLSVYVNRLMVVKNVLEGESPADIAIDYLNETTGKISGETAINELKILASKLGKDGITENSLTDWSVAYAAYNDLINTEIDNYSMSSEASWPSVEKQDALFAVELMGAVIKDQGKETMTNTISFLDKKLGQAFEETTLVFGEDRQDPYVGVYFKKGETNEPFENVFFKLEFGQVSEPTYTEFGLHLIKRVELDFEYFKENMYASYAAIQMVDDLAATYEVTYGEIYNTITPETLK
ncbi:MAG: peptidylprolyl isomerase [Clostridia bacterium]|nr:peptidylprolyl isomerase [Clostridia bacterium]